MRLADKSVRNRLTSLTRQLRVGISTITTYQPGFVLPNSWYDTLMARKFVKHTGIRNRCIAIDNEVSIATDLIKRIGVAQKCDLADCAGLIFVSPSLIPQAIARKLLPTKLARMEQPTRLALELANRAGLSPRKVVGINGFCSGYAKAMQILLKKMLPSLRLQAHEFILVITSSCISRITDFGCRESGALFGDFATATQISRCDSAKYPTRFELLDASYAKRSVSRPMFDFARRENVLTPTADGGKKRTPFKIVFSLDGMGIADVAPRAMANAAQSMVDQNGLKPTDVNHIVPHQAGAGIVRLTAMKLEQAGFDAAPVNGLTAEVGNVSSGSVPFALQQNWNQLEGTTLCPVAAVGDPGKPVVSQGCILLRASVRSRAAAS